MPVILSGRQFRMRGVVAARIGRGTALSSCVRVAFLLVVLIGTVVRPAPATAQDTRLAPDPFLERLVGINTVQVGIVTWPDPVTGGPCLLDEAPLERRALELFRASGIRALSRAERADISRRFDAAMSRGFEALREGRLIPEAEARQRRDDIEFLNNTPSVIIRLATAPVEAGGARMCALTADGIARVQAPAGLRVPLTGRGFVGGLLLWERQARVFSAPEDGLHALALGAVEDVTGRFIARWREANGR